MYKSIVMHQLDYNYIACCEEWYYRYHGPQISRRYGPWLERFESYRPVPLPPDLNGEKLGYTNWLTTVGYWREIPKEGAMGEMSMTSPTINARNFSTFCPPQYEDDFKGSTCTPEEKACLRLVQLWQYPDTIDKQRADAFFLRTLAKEISAVDSVYRFFSTRTIEKEIHLPGTWKPEQMEIMQKNGSPGDHQWDRIAELWFETFDDVRIFFETSKNFSRPSWAEQDMYPYLKPYEHYISTFLLERPAYDWKQNFNVYR